MFEIYFSGNKSVRWLYFINSSFVLNLLYFIFVASRLFWFNCSVAMQFNKLFWWSVPSILFSDSNKVSNDEIRKNSEKNRFDTRQHIYRRMRQDQNDSWKSKLTAKPFNDFLPAKNEKWKIMKDERREKERRMDRNRTELHKDKSNSSHSMHFKHSVSVSRSRSICFFFLFASCVETKGNRLLAEKKANERQKCVPGHLIHNNK